MSAIPKDRAQRSPEDSTLPADSSENTRIDPGVRAEIEAVLSTFRQWLLECAHLHNDLTAAPPDAEAGTEISFDSSVRGMMSEWLALRQELRRDAGDSDSTREQLNQAVELFEKSGVTMKESVKSLLAPLVRDRDRLRDDLRNRLQIQQHNWLELILDVREGLMDAALSAGHSLDHLGWKRRLVPGTVKTGVGDSFSAALDRIDSALDSRGVKRTASVGTAVNAQTMKVVEVVDSGDLPPGHVVEVVRHGFCCGNEVLRFAEVKATATAG